MQTKTDYPMLSTLIGGYLNQDMDMIADTVPEAVAAQAKILSEAERELFARK